MTKEIIVNKYDCDYKKFLFLWIGNKKIIILKLNDFRLCFSEVSKIINGWEYKKLDVEFLSPMQHDWLLFEVWAGLCMWNFLSSTPEWNIV